MQDITEVTDSRIIIKMPNGCEITIQDEENGISISSGMRYTVVVEAQAPNRILVVPVKNGIKAIKN